MAKLSQDTIKWILSLDATQAQEEIHKLNKNNDELRKKAKAAREAMAKLDPKSQEWANANRNLNNYNRQISDNNTKIKALSRQTNDQVKTLGELRKELKNVQREFANTSKALHPERYKELQTRIRELKDRIHEVTDETDKMSSAWKAVGKLKAIVTGTFNAIGFAITENIIGAFKNAFNIILDFEKENARLASILGTSVEGISELSKAARQLGASTSYSAAQVTQLQIELAKLGFAQDDILAMESAVLKFAKSVGTDLASASAFSGAALRIFGKEASETEDVLATFAVATTRTALDFEKLNNSLATVGPVAASFGVSLEDTVALLGQLANAGFDASSAATATRNIFLNLADGSGDLAKALGGSVNTAEEMAAGLKKLQEEGIDLATALELTDKRSVAAFSTFLDNADTLVELRDQISDVNGEFNQMSETTGSTTSAALAGLNSAAEELVLSLGLETTGAIKSVVEWLTKFVTWTGKCSQWIQAAIITLASYKAGMLLATGVTKAYVAITGAIKGVMATAKAAWAAGVVAIQTYRGKVQEATTATQVLNTTIKAIPWAQVVGLILSVVTAIWSLTRASKSATDQTKELTKAEEAEKAAREKGMESVANATAKIEALTAVAKNETASLAERKKACEELNKIIPSYNAHIEESTGKYIAAKGALDDYIESLMKSARMEYYNDMLRSASLDVEKLRVQLDKAKTDAATMDQRLAHYMVEMAENAYNQAKKKTDDIVALIKDASSKGLLSVGTTPSDTAPTGSGIETDKDRKAREKEEKERQREQQRLQREQEKADREQEKQRKEAVKQMELDHKQRLSVLENANEAERQVMQKAVADGITTQEAADVYMMARDKAYHAERLAELESYLQVVENSETLTANERTEMEMKASKEIMAAKRQLLTDTGNWAQKMRELTEDTTSMEGIRKGFEDRRLATMRLYDTMIAEARNAGQETILLEEAKNNRLAEINEEERQKLFELAQITGVTWEEEYDNELAKLEEMHRKGLVNEERYQKARTKLQVDNVKKYFDYYSQLAGDAVSAIQDAEIAASDAKYDVLIQQAKNNGEDTTALEEEKENKKLEIQKKYADVNFAIKVSEIIANTAVSIMKAFSELGPIGGAVAAAMLTATGIAQVAMANAERQKVKNMQPSSSSSSSSLSASSSSSSKINPNGYAEGGYTGDGGRYEVAGIVHKGEYVVPQPIMSNPAVMDAVGLIEAVRQDRMQLNSAPTQNGYADGGPTSGTVMTLGLNSNQNELAAAIGDLRKATENIRQVRAYLVYRDLEEEKKKIERARQPFTRNK